MPGMLYFIGFAWNIYFFNINFFKRLKMNDFLSNDYKVPETGGKYLKLIQGDNVIRILSAPVTGWSWWTEVIGDDGNSHRKPKRVRTREEVKYDEIGPNDTAKHFWALMVYNYNAKQIQLWEITQKGLQQDIVDLHNDSNWGDPRQYDIKIKRTGEGKQTNYKLTANPNKKEIDTEIKNEYESMNINLNDLFDGKDIFSGQQNTEQQNNQEKVNNNEPDYSEPDMTDIPF